MPLDIPDESLQERGRTIGKRDAVDEVERKGPLRHVIMQGNTPAPDVVSGVFQEDGSYVRYFKPGDPIDDLVHPLAP